MNCFSDMHDDIVVALFTGSIVVEFQLLPGDTNAETDLNTALVSLKNTVESGTATISIGGTSYSIDDTSFDHTTVRNDATTEYVTEARRLLACL